MSRKSSGAPVNIILASKCSGNLGLVDTFLPLFDTMDMAGCVVNCLKNDMFFPSLIDVLSEIAPVLATKTGENLQRGVPASNR